MGSLSRKSSQSQLSDGCLHMKQVQDVVVHALHGFPNRGVQEIMYDGSHHSQNSRKKIPPMFNVTLQSLLGLPSESCEVSDKNVNS